MGRALQEPSVSSANHRSTRFSHEELVGVKWKWNLGCRSSQVLMAGVLCVEELSSTTWTSRSAGTALSISIRNFLNSSARCRRLVVAITSPVATFNAAKRSVTPFRL